MLKSLLKTCLFFCWSCFAIFLNVEKAAAQGATPTDLNVQIQGASDTIYTLASLWGTTFVELYNGSQNYAELAGITGDMAEVLKNEIEYFESAVDVNGSKKLVSDFLQLLKYEQKLLNEGFKPFEKMGPSTPDEQVKAARLNLTDMANGEKELLKAFNDERKAYTSKNGIPLLPPVDDMHIERVTLVTLSTLIPIPQRPGQKSATSTVKSKNTPQPKPQPAPPPPPAPKPKPASVPPAPKGKKDSKIKKHDDDDEGDTKSADKEEKESESESKEKEEE